MLGIRATVFMVLNDTRDPPSGPLGGPLGGSPAGSPGGSPGPLTKCSRLC